MSKIHDWRPNPNPGSDGAIEMGCTVDKTMKDILSEANMKKAMAESIQDQKANLMSKNKLEEALKIVEDVFADLTDADNPYHGGVQNNKTLRRYRRIISMLKYEAEL